MYAISQTISYSGLIFQEHVISRTRSQMEAALIKKMGADGFILFESYKSNATLNTQLRLSIRVLKPCSVSGKPQDSQPPQEKKCDAKQILDRGTNAIKDNAELSSNMIFQSQDIQPERTQEVLKKVDEQVGGALRALGGDIQPDYTLDNAVRDICSVSVAPASKSEVRRILQKLLQDYKQRLLGRLPEVQDERVTRESWVRGKEWNEALRQARRVVEETNL